MSSASLPEMYAVQHGVQDGMEKCSSRDAEVPHELRSKLIPWRNLIRSLEVVGTSLDSEPHVVQVVDLAEMDSWRDVEAILGCGLDSAGDESGVINLPQETSPELLDLDIDIERSLDREQNRPKGKLLMFELPPHTNPVPPRILFASNSTGTPAKVIGFRPPVPTTNDGKVRQIMVDINTEELITKGLSSVVIV
jgi:hypothetical protein